MKHHILILALFISVFGAALESTNYLINPDADYSGFGGLMGEISLVKDRAVYSMGGGGGLLINQKVFIGGYGIGNIMDDPIFNYKGTPVNLEMGHGGLWFGYLFNPKRTVHFGLSGRAGWGGIGAVNSAGNRLANDDIFVLTPQADLQINILPFMKFNLSAGYRAVLGANNDFMNSNDLSSPIGLVGFYFGWFGE
ncbi:MAG: hypothetical protein Salg2KO_19850 [Salibacteraceae bacterium]